MCVFLSLSSQDCLVLRWQLSLDSNSSVDSVRIGGLGFSLPAFTHFGGLNLTHVRVYTSFMDASIGGDYGFAHMTRADGSRTLMVAPYFKSWRSGDDGQTSTAGAFFEAYRPVLEDNPALQGKQARGREMTGRKRKEKKGSVVNSESKAKPSCFRLSSLPPLSAFPLSFRSRLRMDCPQRSVVRGLGAQCTSSVPGVSQGPRIAGCLAQPTLALALLEGQPDGEGRECQAMEPTDGVYAEQR